MNINNLNLNLVKVFVAINECGSLTRAADQLCLSQPGVSHALKQLRDVFDDELFVRDAKGYHATRRANELAPAFIDALHTLQTAIEGNWGFDPTTENAIFRISAGDYNSQSILPALINRLAILAPGVQCVVSQLTHDGARSAIKDRTIDLAILSRLPQEIESGQQLLHSETTCCIARKKNPFTKSGLDLDTYISAEHVVISTNGALHSPVDDWLAKLGRKRQVRFALPYFSSVTKVIAETNMIGALPKNVAEQAAQSLSLDIFPLPFEFPMIEFIMMWHPRREKDPQLRWLRSVLESVVSSSS